MGPGLCISNDKLLSASDAMAYEPHESLGGVGSGLLPRVDSQF